MLNLKNFIREVPNWPIKGVNFKDITPLLKNAAAFRQAINSLANNFANKKIDVVAGIDARGFIIAAALAYKLKAGLVIIRKKGKLPWRTKKQRYKLEYGQTTIEVHQDAFLPNQKILLVDDVLATGGTMQAAVKLVKKLHGRIAGILFLIAISALKGKNRLKGYPIKTLINY